MGKSSWYTVTAIKTTTKRNSSYFPPNPAASKLDSMVMAWTPWLWFPYLVGTAAAWSVFVVTVTACRMTWRLEMEKMCPAWTICSRRSLTRTKWMIATTIHFMRLASPGVLEDGRKVCAIRNWSLRASGLDGNEENLEQALGQDPYLREEKQDLDLDWDGDSKAESGLNNMAHSHRNVVFLGIG